MSLLTSEESTRTEFLFSFLFKYFRFIQNLLISENDTVATMPFVRKDWNHFADTTEASLRGYSTLEVYQFEGEPSIIFV